MRLRTFIHQTLVRDADMFDRAIEIAGFGVGILGPFYNWGDWNAWSGGQRVLFSLAVIGVTLAIIFCRRAYHLNEAAQPKIKLLELGIYDDDGEQLVRARIENFSSVEIEGLKARLERVSDACGSLAHGEVWKTENGRPVGDGIRLSLDYPIQLFTQERLRERIDGGDKYARPFRLAPEERRWIEVFQVTHPMGRKLHFYDAVERRDLITSEDAKFECSIHGSGPPLNFVIQYESIPETAADFRCFLLDSRGNELDRKCFHKEEG